MKRVLVLLIGVAAVAGAVAVGLFMDRDRDYRRLLAAGDEALRAGDTYGAIETLSGAIALQPDSMVAYYRRAEAYRAEHRPDEAVRDLRAASRLAPDATEPLVALGQVADQQGDYARAAEWYGLAVERLQDADPTLLYSLALARYRAGAPATAVDPLRQVIARSDPAGHAHYLLGLVYRDINRPDDAIAILEEAVHLAPTLLTAREELADLYRGSGRPDEEMAELQALAALDDRPVRRISVALADARGGRYEAALSALAETPLRGSDDSLVQLARGRVYLARAERTSDRATARLALASLEKALGGTARRSEGLALFGRALYRSGDAAGAERILREAVATSPVEVEAYAYLADASEQLSHPRDARDALVALDALQGDTATREVRAARARRLGVLSLAADDAPAAVRYLKDAVDGGQDDVATLGLLGRAALRIDDLPVARRAVDRALAQSPQDPALLRLARTIASRGRSLH